MKKTEGWQALSFPPPPLFFLARSLFSRLQWAAASPSSELVPEMDASAALQRHNVPPFQRAPAYCDIVPLFTESIASNGTQLGWWNWQDCSPLFIRAAAEPAEGYWGSRVGEACWRGIALHPPEGHACLRRGAAPEAFINPPLYLGLLWWFSFFKYDAESLRLFFYIYFAISWQLWRLYEKEVRKNKVIQTSN